MSIQNRHKWLTAVLLMGALRVLGAPSLVWAAELRADFNGDGRADLAIGVPGEDIGGAFDAGAVNVIYGRFSPNGLSAFNNQVWQQDTPGIEDGAEANDRFGAALAAGDFNGDGFADLAIGVPREDIGGALDAGAVSVIYGSPNGLSASNNQFWNQDSRAFVNFFTSVPIEDTAGQYDQFGSALTAGDFNGDSIDDLAIGVAGEAIGGIIGQAGAVNVIYGAANGLTVVNNQFWNQDSWKFIIVGTSVIPVAIEDTAEQNDQFGYALFAGDFNGDGFADLAIGVPREAIGGIAQAGAVNVIYGTADGLSVSSNQFWHQDVTNIEDTAESGDFFGSALTAGDFNGDGIEDLAIGVAGQSIGSNAFAGAVNVIYGTGNRLAAANDQFWHQDVTNIEDTAERFDLFGSALTAGDFNGDSRDDLAIGVPRELIGSNAFAGAVNVIYGTGNRLVAANDQFWHQDVTDIEDTAEDGDFFGSALTAGDFNGDSRDDLAIGVPQEGIGSILRAGAVNVIYGTGNRLAATNDQLWHQDSVDLFPTVPIEQEAEGDDLFGSHEQPGLVIGL